MNPTGSTAERTSGRVSSPADMPIPDRLNLFLSVVVFAGAVALIWAASLVQSWLAVIGIGIVFSYLLLTNYALLHEAAHSNLQSSSSRNYWLGFLTGCL